ncbi:AurF N-oxygenase family protein [Streptacidiphilus monticola]|uniref:Diiron oxygenase n=1 Tax=Streptacidiphilus monticola TaxID=2161674 RepID=A0ABW1GAH4_9ACTN
MGQDTTTTELLTDREQVAQRLLEASARHTFDPDTELDWEAPLEEGRWFIPPNLVSLYGTPLWERMGEAQRIDLSRHEFASMASAGIWLEIILMQLLARHIYDLDPRTGHVQYALTEVADECRHSKMFARAVQKLDTPWYQPTGLHRFLARILKTACGTPAAFTATLLGEEILDRFQRQTFPDESVQPLVRGITRIHVVEEARHVRYAREELRRSMTTAPLRERQEARLLGGFTARVVASSFVHRDVYAQVGLDPEEARRQVAASAHRRETMRWGAERLTGHLEEIGVIEGRMARSQWRKAGLI